MNGEHTAGSFDDNEWARFWRENGKQVTNYTSIFKGTIRAHEWKNQYGNHILERQLRLAPAGTLKAHTFHGAVSIEPPPVALRTTPDLALANAIYQNDPFSHIGQV